MEEKQMTANKGLESQIELSRGRATIAKVLIHGSGAAIILCSIMKLLLPAIAFLALTLGNAKWFMKTRSRWNRQHQNLEDCRYVRN